MLTVEAMKTLHLHSHNFVSVRNHGAWSAESYKKILRKTPSRLAREMRCIQKALASDDEAD